MPRGSLPLPECLGTTFTRAEALRAGVSSRRLAAPDVERVLHGVYRRVVPVRESVSPDHPAASWRNRQLVRARAAAHTLHTRHCFSHATAAVIHGLPVPARNDDRIDIASLEGNHPPRMTGVRGRYLSAAHIKLTVVARLPVPSPADVWAMLGCELSLPDLVALGDAVIRRPRIPGTRRLERPPLATVDDLAAIVEVVQRRGNAALRTALPLLETGSASAPESHFRLLLMKWGLPEPALDYDVYDDQGRLLGASELAFPQYRLALEYEGAHHRVQTRQWNRDIDKYHAYEAAGWRVIRVTASLQYTRTRELRSRVETALRQRGWAPKP
ncbi:hypothetical protein [Leucobacter sp. NPDC077196]|uniref:hypothetical protein n=1 Tax=Leucobacter sp. NPDC077196 TaxID=3154959 RepID=UPI00344951A8